jgi:6-phosphogluconolactonase
MSQQNKIKIFQTPDELSAAACAFIIEQAGEAIKTHDRFAIALSGGHTPEHIYTLLSMPPFRDNMPWKDTFLFWGDERCVPLDDKDNNARMAMSFLLQNVAIQPSNIYRIPVNLPPAAAALAYEHTLKSFFGNEEPCFDLILLGLGENGHTASLFPGTDVINEKLRLVKEVYVEEQKMSRITMTLPLINLAYNILFLAEGSGKANILKEVLAGEKDKYPAQLIAPLHGSLYWFIDNAAAALLPMDK